MGKCHLGFSPRHHPQSRGFDEFYGFLVGAHNFQLRADGAPKFGTAQSLNLIHRGREPQRVAGHTTELFTTEALGFIDRHAGRPWFLFLAYNAVHTPLEIAPDTLDRLPAAVQDPARRGYLSLLLGLDDAVGRLTAHLRATGRDRDTLIFFLSDNGGAGRKPFFAYNTGRNAPLRGDKGQMLEGGIRVPFLAAWPGRLPAGTTCAAPVSALDLAPTALAAAGLAPDASLDGANLLPVLAGEAAAPARDALFWRFGPQRAVRQGRWKLVDWRDFEARTNSGWQLYDLASDPGETRDLAAAQPAVAAELRGRWEAWDRGNAAPRWRGTPNEDPPAPAAAPR